MNRSENDEMRERSSSEADLQLVLIVGAGAEKRDRWSDPLCSGARYRLCWAEDMSEAMSQKAVPDLALVELKLPDGSAVDLIGWWQDRGDSFPVVVLADPEDADQASSVIRSGASDFVVHSSKELSLLPVLIEKNLEQHRIAEDRQRLQLRLQEMLTEVRQKNQQLEEAVTQLETVAATDPLTGLANRRALNEALERGFAEALRYDRNLACLMLDLDGFKALNDTAGHAFGDLMLRELSRVLRSESRRSDCVGRLGGDEFVVLMPETDYATACQVAERISGEFAVASRAQLLRHGHRGASSVSVGVATLGDSGCRRPEQLLAAADHDLYANKKARRDEVNQKRITQPAVRLRLAAGDGPDSGEDG